MRTIDVIRKAKDIYVSRNKGCMCECFHLAIGGNWDLYLKNNIPLFCYDVAVERFGATGNKSSFWWSKLDRDVRIKYFDWLIERYRGPVWGEYYPACGDYYPDI